MSSGNRELDAILEYVARQERARLRGRDAHRLRYIARVVQAGAIEMQRARRLLADLVEEIERRAEDEQPANSSKHR